MSGGVAELSGSHPTEDDFTTRVHNFELVRASHADTFADVDPEPCPGQPHRTLFPLFHINLDSNLTSAVETTEYRGFDYHPLKRQVGHVAPPLVVVRDYSLYHNRTPPVKLTKIEKIEKSP